METDQWKEKYYSQLDSLEKKEQHWEQLEATLKRTIGRLSLAAEGQSITLDRHIGELRSAIKNNINRQRLESVVDDISRVLSKLEENQTHTNRQSLQALEQLIAQLPLPKDATKKQNKLLKKIAKSDDSHSDVILNDSLELLISVIKSDNKEKEKLGLINRLFQPSKKSDAIDQPGLPSNTTNSDEVQLTAYKSCLIDLLNKLDDPASPSGKISALKIGARDAQQMIDLDKLSDQLSKLLHHQVETSNVVVDKTTPDIDIPISNALEAPLKDFIQPSIQELLIRLLEQLIIPADLQNEANKIKQRLEHDSNTSDWKSLLKDVARLINSIRVHMQKEKHEFETFLQQVTDRLKAMDSFLQSESSTIINAQSQGQEFDIQVGISVDDIRLDINQATELSSLKNTVNAKLDTISNHIQLYRDSENERFTHSKNEIGEMQSKIKALEEQSSNLKKLVIEKNKQAMFDALTEIPNRLFYEKKSAEEIARMKRFSHPLSLAIWDIDLFKKVNDTYGHKAGDKVLKTVAQLLIKSIRETDFLARYGGEEFVMLLPGTKQEETLRLLNKLRVQVESCGFHYHGESVNITISCGVTSFSNNDTLHQVFERADKALYKAKKNGRNQCVVAACLTD